jgi:hypothetical protein
MSKYNNKILVKSLKRTKNNNEIIANLLWLNILTFKR